MFPHCSPGHHKNAGVRWYGGSFAMAAALIFLITYNVTEDRIETNYYKRILQISQELDKKLGFVTSEVK